MGNSKMKLTTTLIITFLSLANFAHGSEYIPESVKSEFMVLDHQIAGNRSIDFGTLSRSKAWDWKSLTPHILEGKNYWLYSGLVSEKMIDPPSAKVLAKMMRNRQIPDAVLIKLFDSICSYDNFEELAEQWDHGEFIFEAFFDSAVEGEHNEFLKALESRQKDYSEYLSDRAMSNGQ